MSNDPVRSPDGSGSRPTDRAADGVSPVPASIPNAARWVLPFDDGGERLAVSFDLTARYFADVVTIRANETDDSTVYVAFDALRWLADRLNNAASAIEARRAATPQSDAVHESAASEAGDAPTVEVRP